MSVKITVACDAKDSLPFDRLVPLQGNLKKLSRKNKDKLKSQIQRHGLTVPFFVSKIDGENYLIDGHQRLFVIGEMIREGFIFPDKLPVVFIKSKNITDAKEKLLAISSQYGKISRDSLAMFLDGHDLDIELADNYEFDAFSISDFKLDDYKIDDIHSPLDDTDDEIDDESESGETEESDDTPPSTDIPVQDSSKPNAERLIKCPKCGHEFH